MEYWVPITTDEHLLYKKEIAQAYGVLGSNPSNAVSHIFSLYEKETGNKIPEIYYNSSKGLLNVYPFEYYDKAIKWFYNKTELNKELIYSCNKRNYKLKLTKILK